MATVYISCDAFNEYLRSLGYTEEEIAALGYQGAPTSTVTVKPPVSGKTSRSAKARSKSAGGKKKSGAKKAAGKKKSAKKR